MNRCIQFVLIILLLSAITACVAAGQAMSIDPSPLAQPTLSSPTEISSEQIIPTSTPLVASEHQSYKDASFEIDGRTITLQKGLSEMETAPGSSTRIITRYFGNEAYGDLNGDGHEDAAFLITQDTGGSGTFFYVVAALWTEAGYQATNGVFLGDRIAPQTTSIEGHQVVVNYSDREPNQPFTTQPSIGVTKYLNLVDGILAE